MISHSIYTSDNRVRRYAESLAARGDRVDVFAICQSGDTPGQQTINGVHVFHIQRRGVKSGTLEAGVSLASVALLPVNFDPPNTSSRPTALRHRSRS